MVHWVKNLPAMQETQEMWVQVLGGQDPLEVEMATHSSILAWKIPWTEEPGGNTPNGHKETRLSNWTEMNWTEQQWIIYIPYSIISTVSWERLGWQNTVELKVSALSNPVFKSLSNSQKLSNIWRTHVNQIMDTHLSFYSVCEVFAGTSGVRSREWTAYSTFQ